jgi:hypothetical protein
LKKLLLLALAIACVGLVSVPVLASAAAPPDPLAMGPYGVNRSYYYAGALQLTVPSSGTTVSTGDCTQTATSPHEYGQSSKCPGTSFPQPLEGSVTWPKGDPNPYKVILILHGRHTACKGSTGLDSGSGTGQVFATGACQNPAVPVSASGPSGPEIPGDIGSETGYWPSWEGYNYMSDLLASWGYVVISPSAGALVTYDGSNVMDAGALARAEIIANTLDLLHDWNEGTPAPAPTAVQTAAGQPGIGTALAGKLDFSKVGIMGHSRGGEGVAEFIPYNRARPAPGRRYNLQAVFALAPIDRDKQIPTGTNFATLLPACDGDVTTLSGANMFERGKYAEPNDPFAKIQFYVEGANHNYYNTRWPASDRSGSDIACGSNAGTGKARLSQEDQRKTGLATIPTFLRVYLGGETELLPWLTGEAGFPVSACPTGATHVPLCEDEVKQTYIAPASERIDILRPGPGTKVTTASPVAADDAGGQYSGSGFSIFQWCNPDPFATVLANPPATQTTTALVACEGPTLSGVTANAAIQSWGPQLTLAWNGPATLTATVRGDARNASAFQNLVFRAAFQSNDTTLNPLGNNYEPRTATQDFKIALVDREGHEGVHKLTEFFSGGLEKPLGTTPNNTQHVILDQYRAPLATYAADGVNVGDLDRVEFRFGGSGVNPTGAIQFADVAFQKKPSSVAGVPSAKTPLPSDPPIPAVDAIKVDEPRLDTAPGVCVDRRKPEVKITTAGGRHLLVKGTASDRGCAASAKRKARKGSIQRVQVAVMKKAGKRCRFLTAGGRLTKAVTCAIPASIVASGGRHWRVHPPGALPAGKYTVVAFAIDAAGNVSKTTVRRIEVSK